MTARIAHVGAQSLGGGYEPRHAKVGSSAPTLRPRRGRYRTDEPHPSAGLYAWATVAVVAVLTWPVPAVIA